MKITKESIEYYIIIKIQGTKKKDSETEKKEYVIYVIREFGEFTLIIPIKEYYLSNQPSNLSQKNRFYIIEYKIGQKEQPIIFDGKENNKFIN